MSREYNCYCHRCNLHNTRSSFIDSGYKLFQCLNCGMCWYTVTIIRELSHSGDSEKTWKNAMNEAYDDIDKRREV